MNEPSKIELSELRNALEKERYIYDDEFLITLYVALRLGRPLLVEGAAGVGKTEVAKVLSAALSLDLIRLQCYEGLDESKALYEWNYQKQLLSIQIRMLDKQNDENMGALSSSLFAEEFLLERPLLRSIRSDKQVVLLIDEIDKTDEEFEAFLLELLSDYQVSIPELGTIRAHSRPIVILTSNNTRTLSEALKRRCAYLFINYPSIEKETHIISARMPDADARLAADVAAAVHFLRNSSKVYKKPSVAETLDWVAALSVIGKERLDSEGAEQTLGFVLKNRDDIAQIKKDGEFFESIRNKHN